MMSTMYRSLEIERREIRLLRLHPSKSFDDVIKCSLFHASLDNLPQYEALSYVWGPLEFRQQILVEENSFGITENLQCALRHLRHDMVDRVLWVDAVCTNQGDIAERNHQVTLMKEIYSRCTRDLAWLGPNPGSSRIDPGKRGSRGDDSTISNGDLKHLQRGMRIFRDMLHHDAETLDGMLHRWQSRQRFRAGTRDKTPRWILSYDDQEALTYLFREAPLWSRIWVMQELSCANHVLLVAGTETLDWEDVALFLRDDNKPYADAFHVTGGHSSLNGAVVTIFEVIQTIQQQRRIMKDVDEGKYESKLIDVLARFRYADLRDPRDVIYGLLGLVSELHPVRVNYGKPAWELFADVTKFFIDSSSNLDIVCQNPWVVPRPKDKDEAESLPSWIVDFKNERRFTLFEDGLESMLFAQRGIFSAGSSTCIVPCEVSHDGLLSTRGVILDKLGPVLRGDPQAPILERDLQKLTELYFEEGQLDDDSSALYTPTGEPLFRAFWRTLVMDCKAYPYVDFHRRILKPMRRSLEHW
ncbi:heterokaryon incompatibility protein-domain-containing protein [Xylaria digitata]|nr:heterokaryon incompatibility protein-domain-containing protein [Xylaria digitata]